MELRLAAPHESNLRDQAAKSKIKSKKKENLMLYHEEHFITRPDFLNNRSSLKKTGSSKQISSKAIEQNRDDITACKVSFSDMNIHEYDIALGDHPECSCGPPISLGWNFEDNPSVILEVYESTLSQRQNTRKVNRLKHHQRIFLICEAGYTKEQIIQAIEQVKKIKIQRRMTKSSVMKTESSKTQNVCSRKRSII